MTKAEAVRDFKSTYSSLYINKADYWTAQFAWSCYTDYLCKGGKITNQQFATWSTPFPYGKPLKPTRKMLEYERS